MDNRAEDPPTWGLFVVHSLWRVRTLFGLLVATLVDRHELAALVDRQPEASAVHAAPRGTASHGAASRGTGRDRAAQSATVDQPMWRVRTVFGLLVATLVDRHELATLADRQPEAAAVHAARRSARGTARDRARPRGTKRHGRSLIVASSDGIWTASRHVGGSTRTRHVGGSPAIGRGRPRGTARHGEEPRGAAGRARTRGTKRHGRSANATARRGTVDQPMWRARTAFGLLVATLVDRHELAA